jgi:hypothetical protein
MRERARAATGGGASYKICTVMENFHGNFFGQSRGAYFFHVYAL